MPKLLLLSLIISSTYATQLPYITSIQEEQTYWIALFGLGVIGILSLYLSSDQLKRITQKHQQILQLKADIDAKQHMFLEFVSHNIETSTKGIKKHKEFLQKNDFEQMTATFFQEEIKRFEKSESLLLDSTHELIDFLQIKSGNLKLVEEPYMLSNVLRETYGFVSEIFTKHKNELVYHIDQHMATHLHGDSKRIEQILRALLTEMSTSVNNSIVSLSIASFTNKNIRFVLHNRDKKMLEEEVQSLFENHSLSESYKTKEKLDLYVTSELVKQMKGTLKVQSDQENGTYFTIELPYHPISFAPSLSATKENKRVLILEKNEEVSQAIASMFKQHNRDVKSHAAQTLNAQTPNFENYDMIVINTTLLSTKTLEKLKMIRHKNISVVELYNPYDHPNKNVNNSLIDVSLQKPLQNEDIYQLLEKKIDTQKASEQLAFKVLEKKSGITKESFNLFSHVYVLIAEDNKMNQKILASILKESGINVIMVNNGEEAVNEVRNNKELDLVLMDTNMPIMDGFDATKKIREMYDQKQLPIVAITSAGFQNDLEKMAKMGANAYLHKPFELSELYSAFSTFANEKKVKVKNVDFKLSKYIEDKNILDIQKGIQHSTTAIFYRELLQEAPRNLKEFNTNVAKLMEESEYYQLQLYIRDTLKIAESIGATSLIKVLKEMSQLFIYKEERRLPEYLPLYTKHWNKLESEIKRYLKSSL